MNVMGKKKGRPIVSPGQAYCMATNQKVDL